ncbi:MAG: hypothetical protein WC140_05025 [Bacteroidales bacterium]
MALALLACTTAFMNAQKVKHYDQYGVEIKQEEPVNVTYRDGILILENSKLGYKVWTDTRI